MPEAMRFNTGKPKWSLVDFKSLEPLVRILEFGAMKYEPDNWKNGLSEQRIYDSLLRHTLALQSEEYDEDSKVHHLGAVMFNAMALFWQKGLEPVEPGVDWEIHLDNARQKYEKSRDDGRLRE